MFDRRSPSGWLLLPAPSRRVVLSGLGAGAAALLAGCGRDGKPIESVGGMGGDTDGAGGSSGGGVGGSAGRGGAGGSGGSVGTGGTGGLSPDAGTPAGLDASAPADALLESDGVLLMPDGSVIPADAAGPTTVPALACTKRSPQIVGPYPAENVQLDRSDIRSDPANGGMVKAGVPLQVVIRVGSKGMLGCSPMKGAVVNAWQCDAAGVYASYASQGTAKNQYLRGYQATDTDGVAVFRTIYPGSYAGRCVHFHFSVRMNQSQSFPDDAFVGQLYFPDDVTDQVLMQAGYNDQNRVRNAQDDFYKSDMLGTVTRDGAGYIAVLELAV